MVMGASGDSGHLSELLNELRSEVDALSGPKRTLQLRAHISNLYVVTSKTEDCLMDFLNSLAKQ